MAEDEDIRRARLYRQQIATAKPVAADADPLAALQKSVAESKAQVQAKNVEIPTIALEQAVNTGDKTAIVDAAKAVAKAQGGSATTQASNAIEAVQAATPKPTLNPANIARGDTIKWVGGVNGSWQIIQGTNVVTTTTTATTANPVVGGGKKEVRREFLGKGPSRVLRIYYDDKSFQDFPSPEITTSDSPTGSTNSAATDALLAFNKAQVAAETQAKRESAFAILKKEFDKYGLGSLVDSVKNLILTGSSPEEVVLKLRETPEYLKRFAGNKLRLDAGLNVYDEATYLDLENAYDQIFTSYGVEEAVGNTRDARRAKYAEFIGGTKSPDEIKGRVQLAVLASQEDAVTKATMKELYPMITDKDLVSYFLNPKETLPKLETKIRAAQVGAAAVRQGLVTNVATAEELVGLGITEEQAEKGYAAYAGMKPRLDFLSSLEKDQQSIVDQQVAEGALLKNLASEQRKILNLQQKEEGRFGGTSGAARGVSLTKQLGGTY